MTDTETAVAPAADTGPLTIDQAVERQMARRAAAPAEQEPVEGAEALSEIPEGEGDAQVEDPENSEAAPQAADDGEGAPETETPDAEQVQEPDPAKPTLDPPARWDAKGKELFAKLPAEAKDYILGREKLQQAAITQAQQKSAEVAKTFETRIQHLETLATNIGEHYVEPGLARMKEWDAWFASDDAKQLARTDPGAYLEQQAIHQQERVDLSKAVKAKRDAEAAAFTEYAIEQAKLIPELIPEMADEVEGPKHKSALNTYLRDEGFPPDRINGISAKEAQLAWESMQYRKLPKDLSERLKKADLYDKSMALAKKPPPPKPKVAAGPTASAAGQGQQSSSSEARFKSLNSKQRLSMDEATELGMLKRQLGK